MQSYCNKAVSQKERYLKKTKQWCWNVRNVTRKLSFVWVETFN